jgi:hypothetical protein
LLVRGRAASENFSQGHSDRQLRRGALPPLFFGGAVCKLAFGSRFLTSLLGRPQIIDPGLQRRSSAGAASAVRALGQQRLRRFGVLLVIIHGCYGNAPSGGAAAPLPKAFR